MVTSSVESGEVYTGSNKESSLECSEAFTDHLWYEGNEYAELYGSAYIQQMAQLAHSLLQHETGDGQFQLLNIEASVGKSRAADIILKDYLDCFLLPKRRKFLIVKRFKEDVLESARLIGKDDTFYNTTVLPITTESWAEWKNKLNEIVGYSVVIITHQRYIDLCLNEEARQAFTRDRHTLIIDEKVDFPIYTFDERAYKAVQGALPWELAESFNDVCKPLRLEINNLKQGERSNTLCTTCSPKISEDKLRSFIDSVYANMLKIDRVDRNKVGRFIDMLKSMYSSKCLYNNGKLTTFDRRHGLWGLRNNIILDANGRIDAVYQTESLRLHNQSRIIENSKSVLHWVRYNSSASNIRRNKELYFEEICKLIHQFKKPNDKVLLVTHKDFEGTLLHNLREQGHDQVGVSDDYSGEDIAVNHFGNLVGKNTYRDFTQCWILGTPNIPMDAHIIHRVQYLCKEFEDDYYKIVGKKNKGVLFEDRELENVRIGYVLGEVYQCVKRIQRKPIPQADIFVVMQDGEMVVRLANEMRGIRDGEPIDLTMGENDSSREPSKVNRLVTVLNGLESGEHPKQEIAKLAGLSGANLNRYWKMIEVTSLVEAGVIEIKRTTVIKR